MLAYGRFDPRRGGAAGGVDLDGQRLLLLSGRAEWEDVDEVHYPGTYAHGVYDRETTVMGGRPVPNEDLVNLPNCLVLKFRIEGEEPFRLGNVELLSYRHELRLAQRARDSRAALPGSSGPRHEPQSRRFVSMAGCTRRRSPGSSCRRTGRAGSRWCPRSTGRS